MGLLSSSKSSTTNNTTENTFNNVDNRLVDGDARIIEGNINLNASGNLSGVTISKTDYGAIDTAGNIAQRAFDSIDASNSANISALREVAEDGLEIAQNAARDEQSRTIQTLIIVSGLALSVFFFASRKK